VAGLCAQECVDSILKEPAAAVAFAAFAVCALLMLNLLAPPVSPGGAYKPATKYAP